MESFPFSPKAQRARVASIVKCWHWNVTAVAWKLHTVIFNNILLNNCVSGLSFKFWLCESLFIKVTLRYESIVPWYVCGDFRSSHWQVMDFIGHFWWITRQLVARIMTILAIWVSKFSCKVGAFRRISFSWQTPQRTLALWRFQISTDLNTVLIDTSPMRGGIC